MDQISNQPEKIPARFALIALFAGMLALTGAVTHFWLGPIDPPPKLEDTIADQAVRIRDKVVARLKGEEASKEVAEVKWSADKIAMASIACISLLAILLSVIGFVRHEPLRMVGCATALGGIALALQYFIIALGAIVFAIILAGVLSGLSFTS